MMKNALLLLLTLASVFAGAQTVNLGPIDTVNSDITLGFARPRVTLNKSGKPVVMWGRASNREVYVATLSVSGFSTPARVTPQGVTAYVQSWTGPSIASSGDTVFVAFKAQPENAGLVYVVRSIDGGSTFGDTVRVSSENWSRFAEVSVMPGGNPVVTYMHFDPNFIDPKYVVATSSDGGISFSTPVDASGTSQGEACDCCPGFVMAKPQRTLVLFRNNDNNLRDIWATISTNGGASFSMGADIDNNNWMVNSCPSSGPHAISMADTLVAVWMSGASGYSRINIGTVDLNNPSSNSNREVTPGSSTNQNYPQIAGHGDTIGVIWQENAGGKTEIKLMTSITGPDGISTAAPVVINPPTSTSNMNPSLVFSKGVFHVVWQSNSHQTVYYRTVYVGSGIGLAEPQQAAFSISPNPASRTLRVYGEHIIPGSGFELFNAAGQKVYSVRSLRKGELNVDVSHLPPGMYIISSKLGKSIHVEKFFIWR